MESVASVVSRRGQGLQSQEFAPLPVFYVSAASLPGVPVRALVGGIPVPSHHQVMVRFFAVFDGPFNILVYVGGEVHVIARGVDPNDLEGCATSCSFYGKVAYASPQCGVCTCQLLGN